MNKDNNTAGKEILKNSSDANKFNDMNALLTSFKKEDARNTREMKFFKWLFIIMIIIYTALFIVNPDPSLGMPERISGLCFVGAFALFATLFKKYHSDFRNVDYSVSSFEMLNQAAKRYDFTFSRYLFILPSILLIDAALVFSEISEWTKVELLNRILYVQAFYIPIMLISAFAGYLIWRRKQKPLRDAALQLLEELKD
jgi:drug/metabolite transporter (DMT)-like permease